MDELKVSVVSYGPNRNLSMSYVDPITGKKVVRSTKTRDERTAERVAAVWQDELNSGRFAAPSKLTWEAFRKRFAEDKLAAMPETSQMAYRVALDHLTRLINPDKAAKVTSEAMRTFQTKARKAGMKETTIARNLRHIKAALRWGERQGLIRKAPAIEMPKLPKGQSLAKHRPVTAEEFDRMLAAVPKVRKSDPEQWTRLLRGLWLSGLRLGEAVALDWSDGSFVLATSGKHPAFHIEAAGQKSRRAEVAPAAPDFAAWILAETPEAQRVGRVFPIRDRRTGQLLGESQIGNVIRAIGRKARVVVATSERIFEEDGRKVSKVYKACAGAHDLRRSFATRWSKRVMPPVLQRLCRHGHISTTMSYYVFMDADELGADLLAAHRAAVDNETPLGNNFGNTTPPTSESDGRDVGRKCKVAQ